MNRRAFLRALVAVPVVAVLAPLVPKAVPPLPAAPLYRPRYLYGQISISEALLKDSTSSVAFVTAFRREQDALMREFQQELNRELLASPGSRVTSRGWMRFDGTVLRPSATTHSYDMTYRAEIA